MRKYFILFTSLSVLNVCAQRMDEGEHTKYIKAVDEYVPAPGQFVNDIPTYEEGDTPESMAGKCTESIAQDASHLVTLGGFGGYITFHFDHSIANIPGEYDLYIKGNTYKENTNKYEGGNSEPGIVMVSKDVNGNGLPDDEWYELVGSADADSIGKVVYNYEITYTRNDMGNIPWTDNVGGDGFVMRNEFHEQEYFPQWLEGPLTFKGTRLPDNGVNTAKEKPEYWVLFFYRYGYVDNKPNSDSLACSFDFDWAVDKNRQPVDIDFVDFVRVYTAVNQNCGWIGESSTEVAGAEDLHLEASLKAIMTGIRQVTDERSDTVTGTYSIEGIPLKHPRRGINIFRMKDGSIQKTIIHRSE